MGENGDIDQTIHIFSYNDKCIGDLMNSMVTIGNNVSYTGNLLKE